MAKLCPKLSERGKLELPLKPVTYTSAILRSTPDALNGTNYL